MAGIANRLLAEIGDALSQRLIEVDPDRAAYFAPIDGRTMHLSVIATPAFADAGTESILEFFITAEYDRFAVTATSDAQPDARIRGTAPQFLRVLTGPRTPQAVRASGLHIDGDVDLVQAFADTAQQLDVDFEALAARYVGDLPARKLSLTVNRIQRFVDRTRNAFFEDQGYYLREDSGLLVTPEEVDAFVARVDDLRSDCERLTQRVNRLHQQIGIGN
jgi:ubiquinone biosynthesis protein UbiJ